MPLIANTLFTPEAINAFAVAVVGVLGTYWIARFNAKKTDAREDRSDEADFQTRLAEDNKGLRQEVWDLKKALRESEDTCERLRIEARRIRENCVTVAIAAEKKGREGEVHCVGDRVDLGPRPV